MTHTDDTDLDALAAQVRAYPPLQDDEVANLLGTLRTRPDTSARDRLVEHHLRIALDEAMARGHRGLDVLDLYQEGTIATLVAINEYAARSGAPAGLSRYVHRVVGVHLDAALEQAELEQRSEDAFVRDAQVLELAEINLRNELGRAPTQAELAALLEWDEERVRLVTDMLTNARELYDADIVQYLDDEAGDGEVE